MSKRDLAKDANEDLCLAYNNLSVAALTLSTIGDKQLADRIRNQMKEIDSIADELCKRMEK